MCSCLYVKIFLFFGKHVDVVSLWWWVNDEHGDVASVCMYVCVFGAGMLMTSQLSSQQHGPICLHICV